MYSVDQRPLLYPSTYLVTKESQSFKQAYDYTDYVLPTKELWLADDMSAVKNPNDKPVPGDHVSYGKHPEYHRNKIVGYYPIKYFNTVKDANEVLGTSNPGDNSMWQPRHIDGRVVSIQNSSDTDVTVEIYNSEPTQNVYEPTLKEKPEHSRETYHLDGKIEKREREAFPYEQIPTLKKLNPVSVKIPAAGRRDLYINAYGSTAQFMVIKLGEKTVSREAILSFDANVFVLRKGLNLWWVDKFRTPTLSASH